MAFANRLVLPTPLIGCVSICTPQPLHRLTNTDSNMGERQRIIIAKAGLDGHDRGAKIVARALRDGGHEVIYTGLRRTPEQIVRTALDEDARFVGLSSLSGAHSHLFPKVCELMREAGLDDVVVFGGGIIPIDDRSALYNAGVKAIFGPGTLSSEILEFIEVASKRDCGVASKDPWHWGD